ncbi:aminotransferase A [Salipaludibacillus agaradhaerens]|uniref:Aminotransferase n=1 Tax=Salipaludibacillus agaradhaerens TaxID=76935 RepID=A0A9Q4B147_SALAG|nr:aminotransferase A [Salipaludibacillus agaradhaerens]MCR6096427.1 aminotransferase A [Salipaludibacillus agaradhaerens]MCR6114014.1 aminotransferase A [Salipaludibacillus agaradhaerens]
MEAKLNTNVKTIQISGIRQFFNRVQDFPDAVQLTLGQPDFPTPDHVKAAAKEAIDSNKTTYTPNAGLLELRKYACDYVLKKYALHYDPVTEIIVTNGASQGIDVTMRTILEPGDRVLIPAPVYPAYEPIIRLCGAEPIFIDTTHSAFKLTVSQLKAHMDPKVKAIILPYPSNPTGAVLSEKELANLAEYLQKIDVFVVADEIYSELNYNKTHQSIATMEGMRDKTIVINGLSKSHAMTGWRVGFVFAPALITQHLVKVHQYNVSCASSISQYAAIEAVKNGTQDSDFMRKQYKERLEFVIERLQSIGIPVIIPEGAFYVFPSIKASGLSSFDFALRLLEEERLAVVPGDAFSSFGEGYIRLSYAYALNELEEALLRLEKFWGKVIN